MDHRKLLSDDGCDGKGKPGDEVCHNESPSGPISPASVPPTPRPPRPPCPNNTALHVPHNQNNESQLMVTGATVIGSMLSTALLVAIFCAFIRFHFNRRSRLRRRSLPLFFGTQEDFHNEDRGPAPHLDNPIWYINTIGLQQSVIDSITVFKYQKDEGLIEGTECSVCLNEFQEDESLRLLPKCSHAFHLPCIDTWLRSHKNCPLCRAPVVCEAMDAAGASAPSEPNSIASGSRSEPQVENSENQVVVEGGTSELRSSPTEDGNTSENSKKSLDQSKTRSSDSGVQPDEVHQPMRRSVSLDLSSAMEIYSEVARLGTGTHKHHGSLDTELQQIRYPKGKSVAKRGNESSSIYKLLKSSSIGRPLSKGPVSMKRSLSSGGKFLFSKKSRSQESIFPS